MITRYSCGHVGKNTGRKVKGFIRVAEIRKEKVEETDKPCPNCKREE